MDMFDNSYILCYNMTTKGGSIMIVTTHDGKRVVEWDGPWPTVAQVVEAAHRNFPGIPTDQINIFTVEAPGDTIIQLTDRPEPVIYW